MAIQQDNTEFVTEFGEFKYSWIHKARDFQNDKKFKYSTNLILDGVDAVKRQQFCDEQSQRSWGLCGSPMHPQKPEEQHIAPPPYRILVGEDGKPDGRIEFKFKVNAETLITKGKRAGEIWERQPFVADSQGDPIDPSIAIGDGSEGRVGFQLFFWKNKDGAGFSMQPTRVQVVKYVKYVGGSNFEKVEGGYVAPKQDDSRAPEGDGPESADDGNF